MKYQVIPLIYAANEYFKNTIRFAIEFFDDIDSDALRFAADQSTGSDEICKEQ